MVKINGRSTKKQGQKKPPKKASKGRARTPSPAIQRSPYALARLDPFNPGARGAKVPDFDNNASCAGDFTMDISLTVDAGGGGGFVFPLWPSNIVQQIVWDVPNANYKLTGTKTTLAQAGAFFTGWDECVGLRVVGGGVKIRTATNDTNANGRVTLNTMSMAELKAWNAQTGTANGYVPLDFTSRKGSVKKTISELSKGYEVAYSMSVLDPTAFTYMSPELDILSTTMDVGDMPNYTALVLTVTGAGNATTPIDATITVHYEWLPGKSFNFMATRPEPANNQMLERINNIAEQTPRIIETMGNIAGNVFSAIKTGMSVAGTLGLLAL